VKSKNIKYYAGYEILKRKRISQKTIMITYSETLKCENKLHFLIVLFFMGGDER